MGSPNEPSANFLASILAYVPKPFWSLTREMLLWKTRDIALHCFLFCGALFALVHSFQQWSLVPVLLLVPLMIIKSRATQRVSAFVRVTDDATASSSSSASGETDRVYTVEQLRDCHDLAAVNGMVFDLKRFARVHPGGSHIRAMGGTDCSGVFGSMHPFTATANVKKLEAFRVGTLQAASLPYQFDFDTPFAQDLRAGILRAMKGVSHYAPTGWWVRFALITVATLAAELYWAVRGSYAAMVAIGVLHALIGICIQHDASHGAVSSNPKINALLSYGADWIGNNRWLWMQQHVIGHHPHCNVEGKDPDAHSAEPLLQFHWAPTIFRPWFMRFQHLYMYLVLPLYGPSVVYNVSQLLTMDHAGEVPRSEWIMSKRALAVAARLFYVARLVVAPILVGGASWLVAALGVPLVTGAVLTFVFVVSHNFEGSDRKPVQDKNKRVDFYKLQVETSCTYGGAVSSWFTGGLNMQIEHHLVPRINSWHYARIQSEVRRVCEAHGVRYAYFPTLWDNVRSTVKYMQFVGESVTSEDASKLKEEKEEKSLMIIVRGKRLDVTRWAAHHPGGSEILEVFRERDATEQFLAMHSKEACRMLDNMLSSSKLAKPLAESSVVVAESDKYSQAYMQLRREFEREGLFRAPVLREVLRFVENMSWYVIGFLLMRWGWHWTGGILYAWGMQQSGWLAHDYLHHSVFQNVRWGDAMGVWLGWLQGYDSNWWKWRHNLHHVATNEEGHDPDIDLAPLLTFTRKQGVSLNTLQKLQPFYFTPLLSFLHLSWNFSSLRYTIKHGLWARMALLIAHHALLTRVVYVNSATGNVMWGVLAAAMIFKGIMTAIFVFSTHYPLPRLVDPSMSLLHQTALTSRNIGGGSIVDWMSGSISRQIEHHLFPMLPRAHLPLISPRIKAVFAKLGLAYDEATLMECMKLNIESLMEGVEQEINKKSE